MEQAERHLKELADLKAALDAHAIVAITDQAGRIAYVNDKFCEISRYSRDELIGQDHRIINSNYHPKPFIRELWTTIARGRIWKGELRNRAKDGSIYWVDTTIVPFLNEQGKPYQYVAIRADITSRKKAEEEKARLEEQLLQSQKMEALGKLAGGVAHDFNNILMVISGQAEMLLLRGRLDEDIRSRLEAMLRNVSRAASLTSQLLAFSRRQVVQLEVLDPGPLLSDFSRMLPRVLGEHISLDFVIDPDLRKIKADHGQITQILLNLSLNARDAMPNGGRLTVEAQNVDINAGEEKLFRDVPPGCYLSLVVKDSGEGIPLEIQNRVFEPFFTTKELGKGTGIGLSTVQAVVEQIGGIVRFYSDPGRGTTFRVYIPETGAIMEEIKDDQMHEPALVLEGSVLIVEDEEGIRETIAGYLQALGIDVLCAKNGKDALALLAHRPIKLAVVVTDMVMPDMGGLTLVEHMRSTGYTTCGYIFMSGYTDQQITFDSEAEQNKRYLQKPFKLAELDKAIRQVAATRAPVNMECSSSGL
jgi:two-component system cell cycle sensor histidine kinase/response regulator CckA